jgi:hypothetical protein
MDRRQLLPGFLEQDKPSGRGNRDTAIQGALAARLAGGAPAFDRQLAGSGGRVAGAVQPRLAGNGQQPRGKRRRAGHLQCDACSQSAGGKPIRGRHRQYQRPTRHERFDFVLSPRSVNKLQCCLHEGRRHGWRRGGQRRDIQRDNSGQAGQSNRRVLHFGRTTTNRRASVSSCLATAIPPAALAFIICG